uniref:Uncharacterized protein n=1 Tax=Anguilla anguilla TaxID=7936 RepID=A0A0E9XIU8_ANGAN
MHFYLKMYLIFKLQLQNTGVSGVAITTPVQAYTSYAFILNTATSCLLSFLFSVLDKQKC